MKKALVFTAVLAAAVSLQAQGLLSFGNSGTTAVTLPGVTTKATSTTPIWVGLFTTTDTAANVDPSATADLTGWTLSVPPVRMSAIAGVFSGGVRTLNGVAEGTAVRAQIRAWDISFGSDVAGYNACVRSGDTTKLWGFGSIPNVFTLGGGSLPTPAITTQGGFAGMPLQFVVPEPSTLALGLLGAIGTLVLFRRRR